jgi:hypothetical protein
MANIPVAKEVASGAKVVKPKVEPVVKSASTTKTTPKKVAAKKVTTPKAAPKVAPTTKAIAPVTKKPVVKKAAKSKPVITNLLAPKAKTTLAKKPAPKAKSSEKSKSQKVKMERDSFTMPKDEYSQLGLLKTRLAALGQPAKKSELLRAGIKLLVAMSDNTLKITLAKVPVIKTGRPKK